MKTWNSKDPQKEGSYICRMDNSYIKMCYWDGFRWFDMWKTSIEGKVKSWMLIPYDGI